MQNEEQKQKQFVKMLYTIIIVTIIYMLVEKCVNVWQTKQIMLVNTKETQNVCTYNKIDDYVIQTINGVDIKGMRLKDADVQNESTRITTTGYHKLISTIETSSVDAKEYVQQYLVEQTKLNGQSNITYYEQIDQNTCAGYLKTYTQMTVGNAEYTIPVVKVIYVKKHDADIIEKHILEMSKTVYDAQESIDVMRDFLGYLNIQWSLMDILSITDVTGTYIPMLKFEYTDSKYFEFDSTTGTIIEYRINDKDAPTTVYIPETIGGVPVKSIGAESFYKYFDTEKSVKKVILPDTVTYIGKNAFLSCTDLEVLQLSSNITVIEEGAFCGCTALKEITLPQALVTLPPNCFKGDVNLEKINNISNIKGYYNTTFDGCIKIDTQQLLKDAQINQD